MLSAQAPGVGPSASIAAPDVTAEFAVTHSVQVAYYSAAGLDTATIDTGDLVVTGPGASTGAVVVTETAFVDPPGAEGAPAAFIYKLAGPGNLFDHSDNGAYTVTLVEGAVKDRAGNPFPAATATFNVGVPPDVTPPTTFGSILLTRVNAGAPDSTVVVVYSDGQGMDTSTFDPSDLTVTGPAGPLAVTSATALPGQSIAHVWVYYTVAAPGGAWDSTDAGRYLLTIRAGAVADAAGHAIAETTDATDVPLMPPDDGPNLRVSLVETDDRSVMPGQTDRVPVRVTNSGDGPLDGPVVVELRTWDGVNAHDAVLATTPPRRMRLKPGQSRIVNVRFTHLQRPSEYGLVAVVDPANLVKETNEESNSSEPGRYTRVRAPFTRLEATSLGGPVGGTIRVGRTVVVPLRVHNTGNVAFRGPVNVDLFGSTNPNWLALEYERLAETARPRLVIPPGQSREFRVRFRVLAPLRPGRYTLKAAINLPPAVTTDPNAPANAEYTRTMYYPTAP